MSRRHSPVREVQREWAIAPSEPELDPARYLGELRELPPAPAQQHGAWCELVVHDREGEMRWTLVACEPTDDQQFARALSLAAGGAAPPAKREEPHLPLLLGSRRPWR